MELPSLVNILNAIGITWLLLLGVYATRSNNKIAKDSGGEGTFLRYIPPGVIWIDTNHPDCPQSIANRYKIFQTKVSIWTILLLSYFAIVDEVAERFPLLMK